MSDLLAELDDQMRAERMQAIWHDHGKKLIAFLVSIVLATALYSGHKEWDHHKRTQDTEAMFSVLKHEDFPNNITADSDLTNLRPAMRAVVIMNAAGSYLNKKDGQETALALYEKLSADSAAPTKFRELATLSRARLMLALETATPAEALDIITTLTANEDGAYYAPALIESATLYAAQGDYKTALEALDEINALTNLPETIYLKARTLQHVYALKQSKEAQE